MASYAEWLSHSDVPKLFINADPGFIIGDAQRETIRTWKNQTEVGVRGLHFVQEDAPDEVGQAIVDWLATLD